MDVFTESGRRLAVSRFEHGNYEVSTDGKFCDAKSKEYVDDNTVFDMYGQTQRQAGIREGARAAFND